MPAVRKIDWRPVIEDVATRPKGVSLGDVARRHGVDPSLLSKRFRESGREWVPREAREPTVIFPETKEAREEPAPNPLTTRAVVRALGAVASSNVIQSIEAQVAQFQQDIASDVAFARERFRTYLDSGDARLAAVGVELWDRAIKHGRLNLGLPSEVIATDTRNQRVVSITQASSTRRLL